MADLADVKDYVFYTAGAQFVNHRGFTQQAEAAKDRWLADRMHELATEYPHWDRDQRRERAERNFDAAVREVEEEGP